MQEDINDISNNQRIIDFFPLVPSFGIINGLVFDGVVLGVAAPAVELCHRFNVAVPRM